MKKIRLILVFLLAFGSMAQAQEDRSFDFNKYRESIDRNAIYYCFWGDSLNYMDYTLIDLDEDGKSELWVRSDEEQSWQGVYAICGDSVEVLAYADGCCDLVFFKNAVGYSSYVSPGHAEAGYCVLKNSRVVASAFKHLDINIFSDEMETEFEYYIVNDVHTVKENFDRFVEQLGEEIEIEPVWHKIE